jgi:hypothetical protein
MPGVGERLDQVLVAGRAAAILGWSGALAVEASQRRGVRPRSGSAPQRLACGGFDALHADLVNPVVAEVCGVSRNSFR